MALVEMKKLRLVAVMADRKRLLRALQKLGCVQIEPLTGEDMQRYRIEDGGELERAEQTLSRLNWAIGRLSRLDTSKKGLLAPRRQPPVTRRSPPPGPRWARRWRPSTRWSR